MKGIKQIIYQYNNGSLIISIENDKSKIQNNDTLLFVDNKLIFNYLDSLYRIIYNWKKEYNNMGLIDGSSWKLSITYENDNIEEYSGMSNYPTNFEAFERLNHKLISEAQNE